MSRAGLRALALLLVLVALGGAFVTGHFVGRDQAASVANWAAGFERERARLSDEVAELRQQVVALERALQVDEEATRTLREQLKDAQTQRLAVEKEAALLRRLIQEGGGGILQIKDLRLEPGGAHELTYRFTVSQLIQDFGGCEGTVELSVGGRRAGREETLHLAELDGSDPSEHLMRFQHFQAFEGRLRLPEGLVPEWLMIEVKPTTKGLLAVAETFAWPAPP